MAGTSVDNARRDVFAVRLRCSSSLLQSGWAGVCAPGTESHLFRIRMLRDRLCGASLEISRDSARLRVASLITAGLLCLGALVTFLSRDNFPEKRELGPEQPFSGSNLERDRDTSGYFRYTHLAIYFQTDHKDLADAAPEKMDAIENECVEITNAIVNRIIDVYRFVTRESHVQRLGALHIPNLYFPQQNVGVYGLSLGHGIRSAVMNRPRQELITIGDMLDSQADIPVPELLFLDAEAAPTPSGSS